VDIDRANRPDVVADAKVLPFRGETFDKVISIQSLEHLWQPPLKPMIAVISALMEFSRVLKKGGIIDLTVPNFAGVSTLIKWVTLRGEGMNGPHGPEGYFLLGTHEDANQVHHVAFTQRNIKIALEQADFAGIKFHATMVNSDLLRKVRFLIPKSRHDLIWVEARRK